MEKANKALSPQQPSNIWTTALLGGGIGLAVILVLALLLPLFFIKSQDPDALLLPMAIIALASGGIAGGFISARSSKGSELISAAITALMMLVPMVLISFLYKKGFSVTGFVIVTATIAISTFLSATAVAKAGGNKKRNMKKLMKKR